MMSTKSSGASQHGQKNSKLCARSRSRVLQRVQRTLGVAQPDCVCVRQDNGLEAQLLKKAQHHLRFQGSHLPELRL